tara:strand:+ start:78 stop:212 length:135 start_codon:yes stop_codon:yes gene_type:complete
LLIVGVWMCVRRDDGRMDGTFSPVGMVCGSEIDDGDEKELVRMR